MNHRPLPLRARAVIAGTLLATIAAAPAHAAALEIVGSEGTVLAGTVLETFDGPWAMTFLPDGRALVTEKAGTMWLLDADGAKVGAVDDVPAVEARGQGGLGDVILHPDFAGNGVVFLSYVERDPDDDALSGAVVERATFTAKASGGELAGREIVWRQSPKVTGDGHYSHRLAVSPDGYLFVTSGERQKFTPAQDMTTNLGKIVRLNLDGSVPDDNPFHGDGEIADQVWTLGHRNLLGIDFDASGQLWTHEMGPRGGDELNRIEMSENYGYPEVSDGSHYSGDPIPDHDTRDAFARPALSWNPVISPSGFVIYDGEAFGDWAGDALIGGLSSEALIRVTLGAASGDAAPDADAAATEAERYRWGRRIREVEQGPDGAVLVLEDGPGGRLIRLMPAG